MKCSIGVALSAAASILGSLVLLALAGLMAFTGIVRHAGPEPTSIMRLGLLLGCLFMVAMATWGIVTAVGLFRLRPWARWSILVFSAMLAFFGGFTLLMFLLVPMPSPPNAPPGAMSAVRWGIGVFYGLLVLLGSAWLYFFNRSKVKAQFAAGDTSAEPSQRPVSISVIGVYLLVGGTGCVAIGFFPLPAAFLGLILTGWQAHLFYLAFGITQLGLGVGLLRLKPLGWWIAIGYFLLVGLNSVLCGLLPDFAHRIVASIAILGPQAPALPSFDPASYMRIGIVFGALFSAIPIWFLVRRKAAFVGAPETQR